MTYQEAIYGIKISASALLPFTRTVVDRGPDPRNPYPCFGLRVYKTETVDVIRVRVDGRDEFRASREALVMLRKLAVENNPAAMGIADSIVARAK